MFKGFQKLMVLREINNKECSGYSLIQKIKKLTNKAPSSGYIYPLLNELAKDGYLKKRESGRSNIYSITALGKDLLKKMNAQKRAMKQILSKIDTNTAENLPDFNHDKFLNLNFGIFAKLIELVMKINSSKLDNKINSMNKILDSTYQKLKELDKK